MERFVVLKPRGGGIDRLNYIETDGVLWIVDVQPSELNLCKCTGVNSINGIQMLLVRLQRLGIIFDDTHARLLRKVRALFR